MHPFWKKVEKVNEKLINPALILLFFVIIFELFIHIENHTLELAVELTDYAVITIFIIDLIFLAIRSKNVRFFFENYWLDIIAVFPFIWVSRILSLFFLEGFTIGQAIFHETLEASKAAAKTERLTKVGKTLRMSARFTRFLSKSRFTKKLTKKKNNNTNDKKKKVKQKKTIKK